MYLNVFAALSFLSCCAAPAPAATGGPDVHIIAPVPLKDVTIDDAFWSPKRTVWRTVTIPDSLGKFERDGALANFDRVRDGKTGEHGGPPWYDGLIYETIRASADFLALVPDPALEKRLDEYIERIAAAQAKDPDGYINTYTQLMEPAHRWGLNGGNDNWQHDIYNAGGLVEAGIHYFRATGKTKLLHAALKLANHMADVMGPPPRKNVVPGHSIAEEAVVKLYRLLREQPELKKDAPFPVDERRYLALAEFWIEGRGKHEGRKSFESYAQDHKPVLEQETIEGHAVRASLLCTGLVAAARVNGRADYFAAARRLWENMTLRRLHITGGVGAVAGYEGFGPDYALPNNAYLETCAAVGAAFFHHGMNLAFADGAYADELERALYNGVLCGVSLKGDTYFYENPLEGGKNRVRWAWHGCPCCPPMFLKIVAALPEYIYAFDESGIYVNLFVGSRARVPLASGPVAITQETRYPWDGAVKLTIELDTPREFTVKVRVPGWCEGPSFAVNGAAVDSPDRVRGYARFRRAWKSGDTIEVSFPLPVLRIKAHPKVADAAGRIALQRGPIVYGLEGIDNGGHVRNLVVPPEAALAATWHPDLLGGVTIVTGRGRALSKVDWKDALYLPLEAAPGSAAVDVVAIPYYANANREPTPLQVWVAETANRADPLPPPSAASTAKAKASHCYGRDTIEALNDQIDPRHSADESIPRFTWWDHRGTKEWVAYEFDRPRRVAGVEVYWWDERAVGRQCRVPAAWRVLYRDGAAWKPVAGASEFGTKVDAFNAVTFAPVETSALRLEADLQPEWSGGILEWRVIEVKN